MYQTVYVPLDNSEYSDEASRIAIQIGKAFESNMVGCHVYAAAMHDYRFKQMEYTLPSEYLQEAELERQRKIHDSLITMGLELISDCYLNGMEAACKSAGIPMEKKMMDGKHHIEITKDIQEQGYDLTVLGALGVGKTKDSQIGSVCERVSRYTDKDVLVVKHVPKEREVESDTILVGVDGSPDSYGALVTAITLAKKLGKQLEVISVYDPYLHYAVFNSIVDVLTEKAAKVFRFEEQNQLHEEVIDTGLAQIYQSHLNVAESLAAEHGVQVTKTLIDGKAFQKILQHARETKPWLLALGRIGVHKLKEETTTLGSNTENLLRMAPCNILLCTQTEYPALDRQAEESILWTPEAEAKMKRVPDLVKGIARTGILRVAVEKGHSVITESVIEEAMDRFMPKHTQKATNQLAEALALEKVKDAGNAAMCKKCGVTAADSDPSKCAVCGGEEFEIISHEVIEQIAEAQGGIEEEDSYDGRKTKWSKEAREELNSIEDKYQKRRAKARIEKAARVRRMDIINLDLVRKVIDEDIGREHEPLVEHDVEEDKETVATDEDGNELSSVYQWHPEAVERLSQIPAGFMRDKTQERVENIALEEQALVIDASLVEKGIDLGRQIMKEVVEDSGQGVTDQKDGKCPFSSMFGEDKKTASNVFEGAVDKILNEAGIMEEMDRKRKEMAKS